MRVVVVVGYKFIFRRLVGLKSSFRREVMVLLGLSCVCLLNVFAGLWVYLVWV